MEGCSGKTQTARSSPDKYRFSMQIEWKDVRILMSATNRVHDSLVCSVWVCVHVCERISSRRTEAHGRFLCELAIKGGKGRGSTMGGRDAMGGVGWGVCGGWGERKKLVGWMGGAGVEESSSSVL